MVVEVWIAHILTERDQTGYLLMFFQWFYNAVWFRLSCGEAHHRNSSLTSSPDYLFDYSLQLDSEKTSRKFNIVIQTAPLACSWRFRSFQKHNMNEQRFPNLNSRFSVTKEEVSRWQEINFLPSLKFSFPNLKTNVNRNSDFCSHRSVNEDW